MALQPRRRLAAASLWALLLVSMAGCEGDGPIEPTPEPAFLDALVVPNEINGLSLEVEVQAVLYDSAFVRVWSAAEPARRGPSVPFASDSTALVPVLGLHADQDYALEVSLVAGDSSSAVDTLSFTTDPLPAWIPPAAAQGADTTPGLLALSYPGGAVIIDNGGRPVWYAHNPDGVLNSFQAHDNGVYTSFRLSDNPPQFRVLDALGRQTGSIGCVGYQTRFHDVLIRPAGDYWVMCDDSFPMDLSGLGGQSDANTIWTVLQHVSVDGDLLWEWNSADHFAITDLEATERMSDRVNVTHGNGITFDLDGNLLLSFRSLNEITKVNVATGDVMWRFGGLANAFTIVNDPKGSFEQQHGVQLAGPGQIQLLDNGRVEPSRFVRYHLNPASRVATLVFSFVDSPTTFTPVGGATQYYGNGHAVVTFGRAGRVVEVDEAGNRAWELVGIDNMYVFRVQKLVDLYRPRRELPFTFP